MNKWLWGCSVAFFALSSAVAQEEEMVEELVEVSASTALSSSLSEAKAEIKKIPSTAQVQIDYFDAEGRRGAFQLRWELLPNGYRVKMVSPSPSSWKSFRYERRNGRRTLFRGYEMWLAPHHLSEQVGTTPFRLLDIETIDRWLRGEQIGDRSAAWEPVRRGERWWSAEVIAQTEQNSRGASAKKSAAKARADR